MHGSGLTHIVWSLHEQYLATKGYSILSLDLPGHGSSEGPGIKTIEEIAEWIKKSMEKLKIKEISFMGHSQGCLVGLEFAQRHPDKLELLALINGSMSMKMNTELLDLALNKDQKAVDLMMDWVHGPLGHKGGHPVPGLSHLGMGGQLVSSNNNGTLGTDFNACDIYTNGLKAAESVKHPTLCIVGKHDKMTPKKVGLELASKIKDSKTIVLEESGHMAILETASETKNLLKNFFREHRSAS